jgi:sugar porter (SP) family MFS transporter
MVLGVAIGLASATAPVYISEVAPPDIRGRLVTFFQLAVTVGIVVAYLVGLAFTPSEEWRWMLGLGAVPAFFLGFGMLRMPQSPRWLVMAGRDFEARAVLARLRSGDPETIDQEVVEIKGEVSAKPGTWSDLGHPVVKAALVVGVGLAILQQVSGINTVIYYAPTIVEFTGVNSSSSAILASVAVGLVNVGMTLVAIRLLDRAGRRPLLLIGSAVMGVALLGLSGVFAAGAGGTAGSVVAVGSLMLYVAAFAVSLGPIFWLLNAELYPLEVRSKAAAVGTIANWFFNFVISLTFLPLIDAVGRSGAFGFYAVVCVFTFFFCKRLVPETKGKGLEDITAIFEERVAAHKG